MSKTFHALYRGEPADESKQLAAQLEAARDVRARAWIYVFDCYAKKRAERPSDPGHEKEDPDDVATRVPQPDSEEQTETHLEQSISEALEVADPGEDGNGQR